MSTSQVGSTVPRPGKTSSYWRKKMFRDNAKSQSESFDIGRSLNKYCISAVVQHFTESVSLHSRLHNIHVSLLFYIIANCFVTYHTGYCLL